MSINQSNQTGNHLFISHATADDGFVKDLREALEALGIDVWTDSRNMRGGDKLAREIEKAISEAMHTLVVLSPQTVNSPWVKWEVTASLEVEKRREGYRTIPILLPGIAPAALDMWFGEAPLAVKVELESHKIQEALPAIMAAIDEALPDDEIPEEIDERPVASLVLKLTDPEIKTLKGEKRARATAQLYFIPADKHAARIESKRFQFIAPLGPIEQNDINWYLESYCYWPRGVFKTRAAKIEQSFPELGKALYKAIFNLEECKNCLIEWEKAADHYDRAFSVSVDRDILTKSKAKKAKSDIAATSLLGLPWELLHDDSSFFHQGAAAMAVKRTLPNQVNKEVTPGKLPIRILLITARPEDKSAGYIDHRASALPLVEAVENLGELVKLDILSPPTFAAMVSKIEEANKRGESYDVIHFDGHGIYDERVGLGALCFEDPESSTALYDRKSRLIYAKEIGEALDKHNVPLIFLEACQTAKSEESPAASVATTLLEHGAASVIAMTHSVLVETAKRFVEVFYKTIACGARVGTALLVARKRLSLETYRDIIPGAGQLHMTDWFVPILYQGELDPQLFTELPAQGVKALIKQKARLSLGFLVEESEKRRHDFVGRSRELLAIERLLDREQYTVIIGQGGEGKTTLAVEAATWLVRTMRAHKAAFVSVESLTELRAIIDTLGQQLVPGKYSVAEYPDLDKALQPIERELDNHPTVIVIDNLETILPGKNPTTGSINDETLVTELFAACRRLMQKEQTRIIFTSREKLPAPFDKPKNEIGLSALIKGDAIQLVNTILRSNNIQLPANERGETVEELQEEIEALVNTVNRHARALTLITNELTAATIPEATKHLNTIMTALDKKYPDEREKSLYASLQLSLNRIPLEIREKLKVLALFEGGVNLAVLGPMLNLQPDEIFTLMIHPINVGLAQPDAYGHIRLDPALPAYLGTQVKEEELQALRQPWAEAMIGLVQFMYEQRGKDAAIASRLTLLELPNLLTLLAYMRDTFPPEAVSGVAGSIEQLLARLHKPRALERVVTIREEVREELDGGTHEAFEAERMTIERLIAVGDLAAAYQRADALLKKSLAAGENAYQGADYDIALAYDQLGNILSRGGRPDQALPLFKEAEQRFWIMAKADRTSAERMTATTLTEQGDCLSALGRLDDAVKAYGADIAISEKLDDKRSIAVTKGQLATVKMLQQQYQEAIDLHVESKSISEELGEHGDVAISYHMIGIVHEKAGNFKGAEKAYRQALGLFTRINSKNHEAATLGQLGNLYDKHGYLEEAVTFYRQACDIYIMLKDMAKEGMLRNNLANTLIKLKRYEEARDEITRAIECRKDTGHAAQIWASYNILHNLEKATGNNEAAQAAWQQAFGAYLAYREQGGYGQSKMAQVAAGTLQAIQEGAIDQIVKELNQIPESRLDERQKLFLTKLRAVIKGSREPGLARDPELWYQDAVELHLLIEGLG